MFKDTASFPTRSGIYEKRLVWAMVVVLVGATLGLVASLVLSHEALVLAENADAVLGCSLSATMNCATVANHWSASLLGIPNSFIGMITMPVVMTIAVGVLAGARFPKWFMRASQLGVIGGALFALWMFYMSFIVVGALCPWCLTTDAAMIIIFFGITRYNILTNALPLRQSTQKKLRQFVEKDYDILAMCVIIVLVIIAILAKYGKDLFI